MTDPVAETWQRKRLAPVIVPTRESADAPTLEELLRKLLLEDGLLTDQDKAASTK